MTKFTFEMFSEAKMKEEKIIEAGSWLAISLPLFMLIDELIHAIEDYAPFIFDRMWRYNFCQWCYRYDYRCDD